MPNLLRNVLALLAGIASGGGVNMALITLSPWLIPPPAGVDVSSAEGLSKAMRLFQPRHFVMPFLAHAAGTLAGALAAHLIAASYRAQLAYVTGAVFLCGGVAASFMIPARPGSSRSTCWPRTCRWPGWGFSLGLASSKGRLAAREYDEQKLRLAGVAANKTEYAEVKSRWVDTFMLKVLSAQVDA